MCGVGAAQGAGNVSNVYCWGYNGAGELGRSLSTYDTATPLPLTGEIDGGPLGVISNAVQIAGGGAHFCALTSTHAILCWGATDYFECGPTTGAISIPSSGAETTCTVQPLAVTLPDSNEVPIQVSVGNAQSCALTQAGNVYCWGADDAHQLGSATPTENCVTWYQPDASIPCNGAPLKVAPLANVRRIFTTASTLVRPRYQQQRVVLGVQRPRPARTREHDAVRHAAKGARPDDQRRLLVRRLGGR